MITILAIIAAIMTIIIPELLAERLLQSVSTADSLLPVSDVLRVVCSLLVVVERWAMPDK